MVVKTEADLLEIGTKGTSSQVTQVSSEKASPLYAVIDLGSNSFHMLITRVVADSVQTIDKVKRKVRLASGLDRDNKLNEQAFARGLECLSFFAERLQDIPTANIRIVATATLRIATNADDFLLQAQKILGHNIELITGQQEAEHIYLGVAHTSCASSKKLVLDIGGASTEIVVGTGFNSQKAISLNMGCVTFRQQYFTEDIISIANFDKAISAASQLLSPIVEEYKKLGWQSVLGGSGTMQALAEILAFQNKPSTITLSFMREVQEQILQFNTIQEITIGGLSSERTPVICSGLAILIALFDNLKIESLTLASGALREGLLYEMLPDMRLINIRERTLNSLISRFHIDKEHGERVKCQTRYLYQKFLPMMQAQDDNVLSILLAACSLHEIGLLLEFKKHQQHGAYIVEQADLPGFSSEERQLLVMLIQQQKSDISIDVITNQRLVSVEDAKRLLMLFRLAIILCHRRRDDILPQYKLKVSQKGAGISFPAQWLKQHPLIADELKQEDGYLQSLNLTIKYSTD